MKPTIRALAGAAAILCAVAGSAPAAVIVNVVDTGGTVTATARGSLDMGGLTATGGLSFNTPLIGENALALGEQVSPGSTPLQIFDLLGARSALLTAGGRSTLGLDVVSIGTPFGLAFNPGVSSQIYLLADFVALGIAPFTSTTVFSDSDGFTSIAEIGLTPGRTVFRLPNDTLTVNIGAEFAQPVPLPGGLALMLGGFGAAGMLLRRHRG